jgi:hypothetical protein
VDAKVILGRSETEKRNLLLQTQKTIIIIIIK